MKLWLRISLHLYAFRASAAFRAGVASRDKEIQELQEQLAEAKWWLTQRPAWPSLWVDRGNEPR